MSGVSQDALLERVSTEIVKALSGVEVGERVFRVQLHEVLPVAPAAPAGEHTFRVCKADAEEERYVLGVVLEPNTVDSQGEIYTAETVRKTAYLFLEDYGNVGLQHSGLINDKVKILESWIQRDDTTIGGQAIKAGTWMLAVHVIDDDLWAKVKDGRITGFSIGGRAKRVPI
jgi:DNA adenine methylase